MNLGLILSIGESLKDLEEKGQLNRLVNYNIKKYSQAFDKVYIFSYLNEQKYTLPKNCTLVPNKKNLNRFLYSLLMPFLNMKQISDCNVLRGLQLTGGIPATVAKIFFNKNFVINYGYDYTKLAKIEKKGTQSLLYKLIEFPIIVLSDRVIVTSKEIKNHLSKKYGSKKIVMIANGVDTNLFRHLKKTTNQKLTILFIGRLEIQKNLANLLYALKYIKDSRVIFVGQGSQKNKLLKLAQEQNIDLELKNTIIYEKIPKELSNADIFVLPSLVEGNPKILLEAMSCQMAVLGSDVEGIRELIVDGKNGLICTTDVKSIESRIKKLQNADLREKLGINAREFILQNYQINNLLTKEANLLLKLAK